MPSMAAQPHRQWQLAECLLPGLTQDAAGELAHRLRTEVARGGDPDVSYVGALLMPGDEVLMCMFAGSLAAVHAVCERAGLPFERIIPCVGLGWPAGALPSV